ncbi:MAG: heme A synthase [Rickettsiales bacterium]|nr:heme A synthase [Rickettsiales bacterium]
MIKTNIKQTWIGINLIMIISMIIIGGITRLTDSGLSMTEWSLIGGIMPPLNQNDWLQLFDKYKNTPEFLLKNFDISLAEFKKIFFWEYFHRIWGRLIGITYTIPFLFFLARGMFDSNEKKIYTILLFLGATQAFMGWFMVQSGLNERPDVSHFRLSAHLLIAFIIYSILLDMFCKNTSKKTDKPNYFTTKYNRQIINIKISVFLVLLTVSSGAFVSGTNAGWAYNNFPYMGDNFLPPILLEGNSYSINKLFHDIGFIQFFHRVLATITLIYVLVTFFYLFKSKLRTVYFLSALVTIIVVSQYLLGIIMLKLFVPIHLGLSHQLGSLILLSSLIITKSEIIKRRAINRPSF